MLQIVKYILKHKVLLIFGLISMLIATGSSLFVPYFQMKLVDKGVLEGNFSTVFLYLGGIVLFTLIKAVFGYIRDYMNVLLGVRVQKKLREEMFHHIQGFEYKYFDSMSTGELLSRMDGDIENVWQTIDFGLRIFVENVIYFVGSSIILFYINWKLALICLLIMIPIGYMAVRMNNKLNAIYGKISDHTAEINSAAQQNIAGIRLVKAFAREKYEVEKFLGLNRVNYDLNMELVSKYRKYFPAIDFLTNISQVAMVIFGGYFILKGNMTLGQLVAFNGYILNLIWPMRMIGWLTDMLSRNQASAKKIFNILNKVPGIVSKPNSKQVDRIKGEVIYKNVDFKYGEEPVLRNVDITIPSGSKVAIMGTTGAGKSSILHLIGRFYDVSSGEVQVDGINVKDYDLSSLRQNMSVVSQDIFLFSDTIENNIKFGNPTATMDEVREVCRIACCLDFIEKFEEGFQTEVGERGIGLSGGQKQRLAIARALLRRASILILDDATSALDMETEFELLRNLDKRFSDSTTFIIAHRISAVKNADLILFVENGRIVEKGNHAELIEQKGRYFEVYKEQFKDFETLESEVI